MSNYPLFIYHCMLSIVCYVSEFATHLTTIWRAYTSHSTILQIEALRRETQSKDQQFLLALQQVIQYIHFIYCQSHLLLYDVPSWSSMTRSSKSETKTSRSKTVTSICNLCSNRYFYLLHNLCWCWLLFTKDTVWHFVLCVVVVSKMGGECASWISLYLF